MPRQGRSSARDPLVAMALIVTAIRVLARIWLGPKAMITYDESCYFTQAEMLGKGLVPYRDFVLAHPRRFHSPWHRSPSLPRPRRRS